MSQLLRRSQHVRRLAGRSVGRGQRGGQIVATQGVMGDLGLRPESRVGGHLLQVAAMQSGQLTGQQVGVDSLGQQCMPEGDPFGILGDQHVVGHGLPQRTIERGARQRNPGSRDATAISRPSDTRRPETDAIRANACTAGSSRSSRECRTSDSDPGSAAASGPPSINSCAK